MRVMHAQDIHVMEVAASQHDDDDDDGDGDDYDERL